MLPVVAAEKAPRRRVRPSDDMQSGLLQQNFTIYRPAAVRAAIVNSSEAFVQLARRGTTCCMIPHLQIERAGSGELINLTHGFATAPGCFTGTAFAPESRMMLRSDRRALLEYGAGIAASGLTSL